MSVTVCDLAALGEISCKPKARLSFPPAEQRGRLAFGMASTTRQPKETLPTPDKTNYTFNQEQSMDKKQKKGLARIRTGDLSQSALRNESGHSPKRES